MTNEIKNDIIGFLEDFTNRNELFTAFDITTSVRELGHTVYHNEVRDFIDNWYNGLDFPMDYLRTSKEVKVGVFAFIYHPINANLDNYDPDHFQKAEDGDFFNVDKRGRLCIPKKFVKSLTSYDNVQVIVKSKLIEVTEPYDSDYNRNNNDMTSVDLYNYFIDKSGNVRLSPKIMRQAGMSGDKFGIRFKNDRVYITEKV